MKCFHCHKEIDPRAVSCAGCGKATGKGDYYGTTVDSPIPSDGMVGVVADVLVDEAVTSVLDSIGAGGVSGAGAAGTPDFGGFGGGDSGGGGASSMWDG